MKQIANNEVERLRSAVCALSRLNPKDNASLNAIRQIKLVIKNIEKRK